MLLALLAAAATAMSPTCPTPGSDVRRVKTRDVSAEYRMSVDADGTRRLVGQYCNTGERFLYLVKPSGHVRGWVGNRAVTFRARG